MKGSPPPAVVVVTSPTELLGADEPVPPTELVVAFFWVVVVSLAVVVVPLTVVVVPLTVVVVAPEALQPLADWSAAAANRAFVAFGPCPRWCEQAAVLLCPVRGARPGGRAESRR